MPSIEQIKIAIGILFLIFFAYVWGDICRDVIQFEPTKDKKTLTYGSTYVAVAGGLATTLSAGVGAIMGVKSNASAIAAGASWWSAAQQRILNVLTAGFLTILTLMIYAIFAFIVGVLTLNKTDVAPEMLITFGLSIFSFVGATFTAAIAKP